MCRSSKSVKTRQKARGPLSLRSPTVPASTAVPAAAAKQQNDNYYDEKSGDVHVWLLIAVPHRRDRNAAVRRHATTREFLCRIADLRCDRHSGHVHPLGGLLNRGELTAGKSCRSRFAVFIQPEQDQPGFLVAR